MVRFEKVSKAMGSFKLGPLDFEIPKGYICGLVGQNGAGKTTLLHILLGLYGVSEGMVRIDGMSYEDNEKLIRNNIGTVLAEDMFNPGMSLLENGNCYGKYFTQYSETEYRKYLALFELQEDRRFSRLSRGQRLKAQFAFALSYKPKLLVLDEPTGNFDPEFREAFYRLLQEFISDEEHSVILATHLTDELDRMADYLIYLENGKLVFADDMEKFRSTYRIVSGEKYRVLRIPEENRLFTGHGEYGTRALVKHSESNQYDDVVCAPACIEDFMYYRSRMK